VIEVAYAELKNTPEGKREEAKQSKAHVEAKMKNQSLRERLAAEVLLKAKESKE